MSFSSWRKEVRKHMSQAHVRRALRFVGEFVEYVLFVSTYLVVVLHMNNMQDAFGTSDMMRRVVAGTDATSGTRLEAITTVDDMWSYLRDHLGESLFRRGEHKHLVIGTQLKVGAVRLVTARVHPTWVACDDVPVYREPNPDVHIQSCFPRTSPLDSSWSADPFGRPEGYFNIRELHASRDGEVTGSLRGRRLRAGGGQGGAGTLNVAAGSAGEVHCPLDRLFFSDVQSDMSQGDWKAFVDELKAHHFVDRQTRVVELLFTVYNAASHLYCAIIVDMTMPFTGGVYGVASYHTFAPSAHLMLLASGFERPATKREVSLLATEAVYIILLARTIASSMLTMLRECGRWLRGNHRRRDNSEALSGIISLGTQLGSYALHALVLFQRWKGLRAFRALNIAPASDEFVDFYHVAELMITTQDLAAVNVLLTCMSFFKFAAVVPQLSMLYRTVVAAFADLGTFLFMFCVVFLGFMQAFQLAFGMDLLDFATGGESFYTLFAMLSGDVDLTDIMSANTLLGPLLFLQYAILVIFILLKVFVAIVTSSYARVNGAAPHAAPCAARAYALRC